MKQIIKQIREMTNLTQEQFAEALGTTVVSINRWENGKTNLNTIAQTQLYNFCIKHSLDLTNIILNKYTYKTINNNNILYHSSRLGINGNIKPISRDECDFGKGFYMGSNPLQPLTLVCTSPKPTFYTLELDLTNLKVLKLDVNIEWALLIAYNRKYMESVKGSKIYNKYQNMTKEYDVIIGYIADDKIYTELTNFFKGNITDIALMKCLSTLDLGMQYVAISDKACSQIKIINETILNNFELKILEDISIKRHKQSIASADEIVKKYRRKGKYFDEIIGE